MNLDVVVCAKNSERTIGEALNQIKTQIPFQNIIVIYGNSHDRTREIAQQYTKKVYWDQDQGLGAARNLGIQKASSELVAMIDTDIILTKNWYSKLIRHFKDNKVAAAMGTCIYGYGCPPLQKYYEYRSTHDYELWGTHNVIFKRKTILDIGNFNKEVKGAGEDYDLYRRLLAAGFKWIWDKEVRVYHPMTLLGYLNHNLWWAKGVTPLFQKLPFSLSELLAKPKFLISYGIHLRKIHPLLSFYVPIIESIWIITDFRARSQRQKRRVSERRKNQLNN